MLRVKDAEKSLKFYQEVLGMSLFRKHEASAAGFNLYFLGYPGEKGVPGENESTADREGLLELTWNYGTEKDENFSYHDGNSQPQGFGHICECPLYGNECLSVRFVLLTLPRCLG
jgi:lactoylglutathione lyase